jgi:hypothetical protein
MLLVKIYDRYSTATQYIVQKAKVEKSTFENNQIEIQLFNYTNVS